MPGRITIRQRLLVVVANGHPTVTPLDDAATRRPGVTHHQHQDRAVTQLHAPHHERPPALQTPPRVGGTSPATRAASGTIYASLTTPQRRDSRIASAVTQWY